METPQGLEPGSLEPASDETKARIARAAFTLQFRVWLSQTARPWRQIEKMTFEMPSLYLRPDRRLTIANYSGNMSVMDVCSTWVPGENQQPEPEQIIRVGFDLPDPEEVWPTLDDAVASDLADDLSAGAQLIGFHAPPNTLVSWAAFRGQ